MEAQCICNRALGGDATYIHMQDDDYQHLIKRSDALAKLPRSIQWLLGAPVRYRGLDYGRTRPPQVVPPKTA